jgi:hypothetical protein
MKTAPVIIEKIYAAREGKNQDFMTLQLRQEREKPKTLGNLRNLMLSAAATKLAVVVAFETMHKTAIETLGLEEGKDFGKSIGQDVTLKITELTEAEYLALPNPAKNSPRVGFQFKVNNGEDKNILVKDGAPVFRKVSIDIAGAEDKLVQHDAMVDSDEFDIEDYREMASEESAPNLVA